MESYHMNSFYAAIIVVCTFLVTIIFVCYKLARQNNWIEGNYSPVGYPLELVPSQENQNQKLLLTKRVLVHRL